MAKYLWEPSLEDLGRYFELKVNIESQNYEHLYLRLKKDVCIQNDSRVLFFFFFFENMFPYFYHRFLLVSICKCLILLLHFTLISRHMLALRIVGPKYQV